jgi:hypothetical protein
MCEWDYVICYFVDGIKICVHKSVRGDRGGHCPCESLYKLQALLLWERDKNFHREENTIESDPTITIYQLKLASF